MNQIKHIPTDNDLEKIVNGVLSPNAGAKKNSTRLILIGVGLVAVGALATYLLMNYPIQQKQKKDS